MASKKQYSGLPRCRERQGLIVGLPVLVFLGGYVMASGFESLRASDNSSPEGAQVTRNNQEPDAAGGDYKLPADPEAVVLSLQYGGGLPTPQQKAFTPTPLVRVTAAGKVITGGSVPRAPIVEMQLSAAELQALLAELLEGERLMEIKPGEIDAAIKESGQPIMIADAPSTTLSVRLADREWQLKQYASRMIKRQYPQVEALQRFVRAEDRLRRLQGVALLGGHDELQTMLAAVNEAIGAKSADLPTMGPESLEFVNRDAQGKLAVTWVKEYSTAGKRSSLTVRVELTPDGQRNINVGDPRELLP